MPNYTTTAHPPKTSQYPIWRLSKITIRDPNQYLLLGTPRSVLEDQHLPCLIRLHPTPRPARATRLQPWTRPLSRPVAQPPSRQPPLPKSQQHRPRSQRLRQTTCTAEGSPRLGRLRCSPPSRLSCRSRHSRK